MAELAELTVAVTAVENSVMRSDCDAQRTCSPHTKSNVPRASAGIVVGQMVDRYKDIDVLCAFPILMLA
jgi:hypothetical protein